MYILRSFQDLRLCDQHCHMWVHFFVSKKYCFKVCVVLFGFWSSCMKVYSHLTCINTQQQKTTPFSFWLLLSWVSLLCWYYNNTFLRFVWYRLVFIQLVLKFIYLYPTPTHRVEQQHHLTSLTSYLLTTAKCQYFIRSQPIILR